MLRTAGGKIFFAIGLMILQTFSAHAADIVCPTEEALPPLFADAQRVDLAKSQAKPIVTLRDSLKIPAPTTTVMVKFYQRESLPAPLVPTFASLRNSSTSLNGVTMYGRYIVVIRSGFANEDADVLDHELVHAYITLASPKPLPFWFQEASAVHFSTDANRRVYGKASESSSRVTEAKVVELTTEYQQKLQSFHYLLERVGKEKFYKWYAESVKTGVVDTRLLLGLSKPAPPARDDSGRLALIGLVAAAMMVLLFMIVRNIAAGKRDAGFY